jgi:hypothetical protein
MLLLLAGYSSAEPASSLELNSKINQFLEELYFFLKRDLTPVTPCGLDHAFKFVSL